MSHSLLVLADLSEPARQAARYTAVLGAALPAQLALLHCYHSPLLFPELVTVTTRGSIRSQVETADALRDFAQQLALPTEISVSVKPAAEAVRGAIRRHQPLLLAMGLSPEQDLLDQLLHNQLLPVLRATHYPVLLVPAAGAAPRAPRRVLWAVDAGPFVPNAAARRLAPLLASWEAAHTITHSVTGPAYPASVGQLAMDQLRHSRLLPFSTQYELYTRHHDVAAKGILEAMEDVQPDLLVLIARPRSFLGQLFHRSVTAQVLRHCRVPVLLVPAEAPEQPDWMPCLC
ncbi:hypothetical protein GCM10023185_20200 [Hymenobacter saemangeumensis]|uniref:UspA domain-containing protein n=1 Tax=Hymenobacter saemangeumensis TaxID=1084522 RepID=A0ABP8ID59_9BACT